MKRIVLAISALLLSLVASAAHAESIGPFTLLDDEPTTIYLDGGIEDAAALDFKRALRKRPEATTIVLKSDGGLVEEALLIAHEINSRGLDTYIPADSFCYSACAYVFLAGTNRKAVGELGVHQVYGTDDGFDVASAQIALSDVLDALNEFGVPPEIISDMLRTTPDSMYVYTPQEAIDLGIDRAPSRDFAALDALHPPPPPKPPASDIAAAAGCVPIESRVIALKACVAKEWTATRGTGAQEFLFGTADDAYGLMLVTESEFFTREVFRDAIIQNAVSGSDGAEDDVQVLSERHAQIGGRDFDLIVYSVNVNGMPLMFQNNYYSDPDFGALQIISYSLVSDSFAAAVRLQTFLATVKFPGATDTPLPAPPPPAEEQRRMDQQTPVDIGL